GFDLSTDSIFIKGNEGTYIGKIHRSLYTDNLVLSISTPILVRDIFSGILIINFDMEKRLYEILINRTGLGETGIIYLVNKDGYMINPSSFTDKTLSEKKMSSEQINLFLLEHIEEGLLPEMEEIPTIYSNYNGIKVLGTHYYIPEMQWGLIAEFDVGEAYKSVYIQTAVLITIFSILFIVITIVTIIISRNITLPIAKLQKGTGEIIKGKLDYKIGIESKDEIGQLSHSFDIMTGKLREVQKKLKDYAGDLEFEVEKRTAELEKQFRKSEKQRIANLVILNDLNKTTKNLKTEISEHKKTEKELTFHREHLRDLAANGIAELENETKKVKESHKAMMFLLEDVNDARKELEDSNIQLTYANKELESFSYSVSHDLRSPLRAIDGFSRMLMENYGASLDDEGKRLGLVIRENTRKMGQLIDDLLDFSRIGRTSMSFSEIDMHNMAKDIYYEATSREDRLRINFTISDLPKVKGDPKLLHQVWINLITNAIKFSANRQQAVISITCREEENKSIYCIQDNGAGFNMKYKDKLFGVFQRLHNEKEFEGTGVGLALVQRIIHRHGGEVWANGEVDNGAAFYFSLPKNR
ncbi:MAG: HAMP domain-containing protein, partial [Candidatus Heimdallarchaeota archaeon]|nr:HAMP domain-containing protein [Candidatus Heimdallarchaeota archaeon]